MNSKKKDNQMFSDNSREIERFVHAQELIEIIARLTKKLNSASVPTTIDCHTIYCHKTGRPLSARSQRDTQEALAVHGAEFTETMLYAAPGGNCHLLWLQCDPETLDRLLTIDPRGYAVYCLRLLTAPFYKSRHQHAHVTVHQIALSWALARAWQILGRLSSEQLTALNEALCLFVSYMPESGNFIQLRLRQECLPYADELAALAVKGELIPVLKSAINRALASLGRYNGECERETKRIKFEARYGSPLDMARGPSQIRGQKKAKKAVQAAQEDQAMKLRADIYGEFQLGPEVKKLSPGARKIREHAIAQREIDALFSDGAQQSPGNENWRSRFARMEKPQEVDFGALDDLQFQETIKGSNPNTVEVRTIPALSLAARIALQKKPAISEAGSDPGQAVGKVVSGLSPAPSTKPLSALERILAKRNAK